MKKYILCEVADIQTGPFGSQLHQSDYQNIGTPIITVEHLGENRVLHNNLPLVSDKDKKRLKKYIINEGDIIFSRVGSVDRSAYVSKFEDDWMFSGRCLRVRPNRNIVNSRFLSFYFQQEHFKDYIRAIAVGATMPSINTTILSNIEIQIPSLDEQEKIAKILSDLDDKIELNDKMNHILVQIAQTIFKHWFIDFEFPNDKGKPYKSSGGKMVDSDIGKIPKGWKIGVLEDVASDEKNAIVDGPFGTQMKIGEYVDEGIPIIEMNFLEGYPFYKKFKKFITEDKYKEVERSAVKKNDIVISKTGTLGLLGIMTDLYDKAIIVSRLAKITVSNQKASLYYVFLSLLKMSRENYWNSQSSGSTMPLINLTHIKKASLIIPDIQIQNIFELQISNIYKMIHTNLKQNQTLSQLRDSLLPRLMSGKIQVTS